MNISMKQKQNHGHRENIGGSQGGTGSGGGMDWEFGISRYKLVYIEGINNRSYCIAQGTIFDIL